jgi:hypothetical protein
MTDIAQKALQLHGPNTYCDVQDWGQMTDTKTPAMDEKRKDNEQKKRKK